MDEEYFPRTTRSSAPVSAGAEAKTKEEVLFQEGKRKLYKRKDKESPVQSDSQKRKKLKKGKTSKHQEIERKEDDHNSDVDFGCEDSEDDKPVKPKQKIKEKGKKIGKKKAAKKDEIVFSSDEDGSEDNEAEVKKHLVKPLMGSLDEDVEAFDGGVRRKLYVSLSQKTITSDMVLLAVVKEVRNYEILLSLPGGATGFVKVTNISDIYTRYLANISEEDDNEDQEILRPSTMFTVGSLVACKVKSVESTVTGKPRIQVSLNPADINGHLTQSLLRKGMVLNGCVSSMEDHGYMIDLGIGNVQAFLCWKDAREFITKIHLSKPLYIGQPIQCLITEVQANRRSVILTAHPSMVAEALADKQSHTSLQSLTPGTKVQVTVVKVNKDHLVVTVLDNYCGHVAQRYVENPVYSTDHYKQTDKITGTILCNNQTLKTLAISLNSRHNINHFDFKVQESFDETQQGQILEHARVLRVDAKDGLLVKVNPILRGLVHPKQFSGSKEHNSKTKFMPGDQVKCRIVDYNWFDGLAELTMKKSTLAQPILGYHDIKPGQVIEGKIFSFSEKGVKVRVGDRTFGFIPNSHLADIPISKPKEKYKIGANLKLRVLSVNPVRRHLVVTHKKTMVESTLPVITAYDQVKDAMLLHGFIVAVKEFGCIVSFYNNVKGLIPSNELNCDPSLIPAQVFNFGQVVKCRVIQVYNPRLQKITLSLRKTGTTFQGTRQLPSNMQLGQVESVKVSSVSADGLNVSLKSDGSQGFIPIMHLSDHHDNCRAVLESFKEGSVIQETMLWSYSAQKSCPIFTCSPLILKSLDKKMTSDLKCLEPGTMTIGHVKHIVPYGVFVQCQGNLVGLAPKGALSNDFIHNTENCYKIGQIIRAQVTQVDKDKGRFLVSLRSSQCMPSQDEGLQLLEDYLSERDILTKKLKSKYKHIVKLSAGETVDVVVMEITDDGLTCRLPDDITGIVTKEHMNNQEFKDGSQVQACVLHSNYLEKTVYLSLKPQLIGCLKNNNFKKKSDSNKGKKEATVEFVHSYFVLVSVPDKALMYLPGRNHLNSIQVRQNNFTVGQKINVIGKRVVNGRQLAVVVWENKSKSSKREKTEVRLSRAEKLVQLPILQLGQVVTARIDSVKEFQLFVATDIGICGRVHITEIADDLPKGSSPLESFKVGDMIKAKIIGHREIKQHNYLPITHQGFKKIGLELSMRQSVLKSTADPVEVSVEEKLSTYERGSAVSAVVQKFDKNMLWMILTPEISGKVYQLNLSKRLSIVKDPAPYFKVGTIHHAYVLQVDKEQQLVEITLAGDPSLVIPGAVLNGRITNLKHEFGLRIQLPYGLHGNVHITDIHNKFQEDPCRELAKNQFVRCCVLSSDDKTNLVLSMKPSVQGQKGESSLQIQTITDVKEGQLLQGYVKETNSKEIVLSLSRTVIGQIGLWKISSKFSVANPECAFPPGKLLTARVISVNALDQIIELSLCHGDTGLPDQVPKSFRHRLHTKDQQKPKNWDKSKKKRQSNELIEDNPKAKKKKPDTKDEQQQHRDSCGLDSKDHRIAERQQIESSGLDSGVDETDSLSDTVKVISRETHKDSVQAPRLDVAAGFSWDDNITTAMIPSKSNVFKYTEGDLTEEDSDTEEEKEKIENVVKKSKMEREADRKAEEDYLYKTEHAMMDNEHTPQNTDEFDRLVVSSPDSSLVWIRYMAFHLHSAEVEKARAVAERAIKAINFREEQEKLNVWVAYLNLENMYGTEESLMNVFQRALQFCEPIKVFQQLIHVYIRTEKVEAAEQLYSTMVKHFKFNKEVWISYGMFLMKNGKQEAARKLMHRSFKSIHQKEHVDVIVKFSQLEFKFGETERGKTMFENILSNYPKRTDIWSVYLDMMVKNNDLEDTRHVFERVIHLTLSAKKMKFFFKRYLDFEKRYGSESSVNSVKEKAVKYVESKADIINEES